MNIKEIHNNPANKYDPVLLKELGLEKVDKKKSENVQKDTSASKSWKKEILMDALDVLENNIQVDNNHPLGSKENAPIENFDEAREILSYINSDEFIKDLAGSQANIKPEQVIYLFSNE